MIVVDGGIPLSGEIHAAGAKNAALPSIIATLLTDQPVVLRRIPQLADVETAITLIGALGKHAVYEEGHIAIREGPSLTSVAPDAIVRRMRASFLTLGPLLARMGEAHVPMPGGCAIGTRPVDLHLRGLEALGAEIQIASGVVHARAVRLRGATVRLDFPSVGATEQLLLTGALAEGETVIVNAAREPELEDLGRLLTAMGATVRWEPDRVTVLGQAELQGTVHTVIADRIETGTYLIAGAMTRGTLRVSGSQPSHQEPLTAALRDTGVSVTTGDDWIEVTAPRRLRAVDVRTGPYPSFPTDLQPPWVSLMTTAAGTSLICETVFESRFGHVPELVRMGARIRSDNRIIKVDGPTELCGAPVHAPDIRAGAALLVAGLAARGRTELTGVDRLYRGYDDPVGKLKGVGARIWESESKDR